MKNRNHTLIVASIGMLVLILDSRTGLHGAKAGLELCIQTLIPSLFPFFVFSIMLTASLCGHSYRILRPLERFCKIRPGNGALLLIGLLGGYPTGAQNITQAWRSGQLSEKEAERMIGFCNNAGPAFLFGMVGQFFDDPVYPWLLWLIHIFSALLVGAILPVTKESSGGCSGPEARTLSQSLELAVKIMGIVCGWVIFFRIIIEFLSRWILWLLPVSLQILIKGVLELSNGCVLLGELTNMGLRFLLASLMIALGGTCVAMQTRSVTQGLSLKYYFTGKLLQGAISFLLAALVQSFFPGDQQYSLSVFHIAFAAMILLTVVIRISVKNRSSIPAFVGV